MDFKNIESRNCYNEMYLNVDKEVIKKEEPRNTPRELHLRVFCGDIKNMKQGTPGTISHLSSVKGFEDTEKRNNVSREIGISSKSKDIVFMKQRINTPIPVFRPVRRIESQNTTESSNVLWSKPQNIPYVGDDANTEPREFAYIISCIGEQKKFGINPLRRSTKIEPSSNPVDMQLDRNKVEITEGFLTIFRFGRFLGLSLSLHPKQKELGSKLRIFLATTVNTVCTAVSCVYANLLFASTANRISYNAHCLCGLALMWIFVLKRRDAENTVQELISLHHFLVKSQFISNHALAFIWR